MEDYSNQEDYGYEQEEREPYTVKSAGIKYGVYLGIVSVVLALVQFMSNGAGGMIITIASLVISIAAIIFAHNEFKKNNDGFMSYSEGLGIGVLVSVVSGVIGSTFSVLYRTVIDSEFTKRMIEQARQRLEDAGSLSDAEIDQAMSLTEKMSTPAMSFFIGIIGSAFMGLVISLIVSAITKNKRPMFD